MAVYFFTLSLISIASILEAYHIKLKNRIFLSLFLYFVLIFQVGFRWETGTDWTPYLNNFYDSDSVEYVLLNALTGIDLGYGLLVLIVRLFSDQYTVFLLVHSAIYYTLIFSASDKLSPYPALSFILFYASTIGYMGSNRQLIALSICLFALQFSYLRIPKKFFACVTFASFFHISAIIFSTYYFLNRNLKNKHIIVLFFISFVLRETNFLVLLFSSITNLFGDLAIYKFGFYSSDNNAPEISLSLFGLIRRLLLFLIFLYGYKNIHEKFPSYNLMFNGYFFGLLIYITFSDSLPILINRGSLYFNVMENFLLACQLLIYKDSYKRAVILLIILAYSYVIFFQSISNHESLFIPYKGLFINSHFYRLMY